MSVLLGLVQHDGAELPVDILMARLCLARRYADGDGVRVIRAGVAMGLLPYASHTRERLGVGPLESADGDLLSFDGRLDNYEELAGSCGLRAGDAADAEIVLAAYARWGDDCFARLTGDWALSLWCKRLRRLFLARDHAGTRTLYYCKQAGGLIWSSVLDDLITTTNALSTDYAARYLGCRRTEQFTPYNGVLAVRPGHLVVSDGDSCRELPHWSPCVDGSIHYTKDREYEEHFRWLFERAVTRRTGSGAPILAQLSGGMDSSSIVCMSDFARRRDGAGPELLDTISYFNDAEPTLDDKRYFMAVEAYRGKSGIHLDAAFAHRTFTPVPPHLGRYLLPGGDSCSYEREVAIANLTSGRGYRAILSGHGGDEVLGGVPTGLPELGDLLMTGSLLTFTRRAFAWSMPMRIPLIQTMASTAKFCLEIRRPDRDARKPAPVWLSQSLRDAFVMADWPFTRDGHVPVSRLSNAWAWGSVLETLPNSFPNILSRYEYRYPFLDKDLVTFLFRIPRDQILRPGRSRDLMRRTLAPILPDEVTNRKRKAFQLRGPMLALERSAEQLKQMFSQGCLAWSGLVDVEALLSSVGTVGRGHAPELTQPLLRAVGLELWMRTLPSMAGIIPDNSAAHASPILTSSGSSRSSGSQANNRAPLVA